MFTGIIQDTGKILAVKKDGDWRFEIETRLDLSRSPAGASICCSGVCLTMVQKGSGWFAVDVSQETLSHSGISLWTKSTRVNLEPSLRLGDELGGHLVYGHVDAQAEIVHIAKLGDSYQVDVEIPQEFKPYIAPKGSVTLDGVSLTVNKVEKSMFSVNIIPHTWQNTTFSDRKPGDKMNIEIDMLARYAERILNNSYWGRSKFTPSALLENGEIV